MHLSDFDFELPADLIARYPLKKRSASRLFLVDDKAQQTKHKTFQDVLDLLNPGDLLIFNDTKVIPARLIGQKATGGRAEILVERILDNQRILAQVRASKPPRPGEYLLFEKFIRLEVLGRHGQFFELQYRDSERTIIEVVDMIGQIPLPPYMQRDPDESDKERYQTIYAKADGSVAAPTAGLHFDDELMAALMKKGVKTGYLTLHIGAGTFSPVRVEDIRQHQMHSEYFSLTPELCEQIQQTKAAGKRVIAVGTTSLRALETAAKTGTVHPFQGETNIFIYPGYRFNVADALITNLHLPRSSLYILVCAFGGYERMKEAYQQVIQEKYRFYSYGDAMWIQNEMQRLS